ncbi:MAG: hypothetical protein ACR2KW_04640 [Rubrobacter sp.]
MMCPLATGAAMMRGRATRLRRPSFVPNLQEIMPEDVSRLPGFEEAIRYWTGREVSAREWVGEVRREWGSCGFCLCRGDEVLGFLVYAPRGYLPQFAWYPFEGGRERDVVLACVTGDVRTEKRLIVRMIRDCRLRGVSSVRAIASDGGRMYHASTCDLLRMGWEPVERSLYLGRFYTLFNLELCNTVEAGEFARILIGQVGQVRLPQLRPASPGSLASRAIDEMKLAFEESDDERTGVEPQGKAHTLVN